MRKSNQQNIEILLGFSVVVVVFSFSQGLPYSAFAGDKASTTGAKRQDLSYSSPSSTETPSTPYGSDQTNAYSSDTIASGPQSSYASSSDQQTPYGSSPDQQSSYTNSTEQVPGSSEQGGYNPQTTSSYATGSEQQSSLTDQSNYNTADQSLTSQPSQSTDSQHNTTDNSNLGTEQSALDQSQAADYAQNETQSAEAAQRQSQATQYTPDEAQTSANATQNQASSYYTGTDQANTAAPENNESQSAYPSSSQLNSDTSSQMSNYAFNSTDTYASQPQTDNTTQVSQNTYETSDTPYPSSTQSNGVSGGAYSEPQQNATDKSRYEVVNVTSKTVPSLLDESYSYQEANASSPATMNIPSSSLSALGLPSNDSTRYNALLRQGDNTSASPVYLSSSDVASIPENAASDTRKFPSVSKETTITGNQATTYLELPKHLHKPAIVKYDVQIEPKTKGQPVEQVIAIMPPAVTNGQRKPLVLLKQSVTKPTEERIQIIVPKEDSTLVNTPKVEVKGGHVDQEDANSASEMNQNGVQGGIAYQGEGQAQVQGQSKVGVQGQAEAQDFVCQDLPACSRYNPSICDQKWMRRHCKRMCGLCSLEEASSSPSPTNDSPSPKSCEYGGVVHQSGETWSPGPCVPKCQCLNGFANCSKVECPDLNCDKPMKRRWKCCPECLPTPENETRCGVDTRDGNGEGLCCVFPFNYRGVDYYTCTTADASEPWCSITRNYDRDGLWGMCVGKSKIEDNRTRQADTSEKSALVLAAQLSSARKWRNSSNNQVTDSLKTLPSPLSQTAGDKLNASDLSVAYSHDNLASQNSYEDYNESSNPRNYYSSTDVNSLSYNDNTSHGTTQNSYNPGFSDTSTASRINGLGTLMSTNASNPSEKSQENSTSLSTASSMTYDQQQVSSPAAYESSANYSTSLSLSSNLDQNANLQSETTSSENGGSYSVFRGTNTGDSQYVLSNDETSRVGESSYTGNYSHESTVADSSDNVVPHGIENQTSYEMNPDASTAQYGNNRTSTT